jgi:superfamily II DNA or RNA helicase
MSSNLIIDVDTGRNNAKLIGEFSAIREFFSVKNKASVFARKRGFFAAERIYSITPTGKFKAHFFEEIIKYSKTCDDPFTIELSDEFKKLFNNKLKLEYCDKKLKLDLRPYQEESVKAALEKGHGIIELATAGGKTLIMSYILENIFINNPNFKCLLIVPDLGLVNQSFNDFKDYGVSYSYSKWTGSIEPDLTANVIIANIGILQSELSDISWTENVDLLIVDEVHKVRKGNQINKIIDKMYTTHRFGFTGTLPEEIIDVWNIFSRFGSVIFTKTSHSLKQESFVTPAKVTALILNYKTPPVFVRTPQTTPADEYINEIKFLLANQYRNSVIRHLCEKFNNNSLILVDLIDHGESILNALKDLPGKEVYFIRGEVEVEERKRVQDLMEKQTNICVIAISKIFSTGINIKNLHYLVFAGGGKAKVKIVQSIGRGLRLHEEKKELIIFDIADNLKYGMLHYTKRKQLYSKEKIPHTAVPCYEK